MLREHIDPKTLKDRGDLVLFVDGGCEPKNPGGIATSGWALYDAKDLKTPLAEEGRVVQENGPKATNNFGEYGSLVYSLLYLEMHEWNGNLEVRADSKLLVEQVKGSWQVKAEHLKPLRKRIWELIDNMGFHRVTSSEPLGEEGKRTFTICWIPREKNSKADSLCHEAYEEYLKRKEKK